MTLQYHWLRRGEPHPRFTMSTAIKKPVPHGFDENKKNRLIFDTKFNGITLSLVKVVSTRAPSRIHKMRGEDHVTHHFHVS
jgi:hypothetical protein